MTFRSYFCKVCSLLCVVTDVSILRCLQPVSDLTNASPAKSSCSSKPSPRCSEGFPCGSVIKNPPANAGNVGSLGQEDPLEREMATHSSILASKILWTEEPGRLHSMGSQELDKTVCAHKYKHTHTVHGFIKYRS